MREVIQGWLADRPRLPGVLACGVRFPDKSTITESYDKDFPASTLENVWRCVGDAFQVMSAHRMAPTTMRWVHENAVLYCTRRPDGIVLSLFTSPNPADVDLGNLERLLRGFRTLEAPDGLGAG